MSFHLPTLPSNRMWFMVWKLLQLRLLILWQSFRRGSARQKIAWILFGLVIAGLLVFLMTIAWGGLRFISSPRLVELMGDTQPLLESIPTLVLSGTFIGVLFTSFGVLLQAMYLAGDMDFLLSKPIPIRSVFVAKMLQAILPNFGLICLFALPLLFGLGISSGFQWLYYLFVPILLFSLALAAAGVSSILVMLIVRIFPARRVAEILGFVGAIASFVCSQSGQFANLSDFEPEQAQTALQWIVRVNTPWSPLTWAGRGLAGFGRGEWLVGLGGIGLTIGTSLLIFGAALTLSERLYYSGWANIKTDKRRKKVAPPRPASARSLKSRNLIRRLGAASLVSIIQKDLLVLRRDIRNMSQLVMPLILGIFYFVLLLRGGNDPPNPEITSAWLAEISQNAAVYSQVGLSLFVSWMLLSRLAGMGFAQEGKNYWILKSAPVATENLIASKFLVAYLPTVGLSLIFLLITWLVQRPDPGALIFSIPAIALTIAGNTGIYLAFGILGTNLDWEDPRLMQKRSMGCLGALATMGFLPISLALFFGPAVFFPVLGLPALVGKIAGLILGGILSLVCALVPPWLVRNRVDHLGET